MPIRKVSFSEGEYYHLYNRGNSRQTIFRTTDDYNRFVALLYLANGTNAFEVRDIKPEILFALDRGTPQVAIGAYCLMPNHFHILVTPLVQQGVTTFARKLTVGYSMYFNKKYHRTGSLFEGRFKSEHAEGDRYLKYLFSYIHLNPIKLLQSGWREVGIKNKAEALAYLKQYQYSSYVDGEGSRPEAAILNLSVFPDYFSHQGGQDDELLEWLSYGPASNTLPTLK
ncbi:transposase [Patescibacteria group bacterium]|nr:transposase [Patescibacteria group bacterium]